MFRGHKEFVVTRPKKPPDTSSAMMLKDELAVTVIKQAATNSTDAHRHMEVALI